MSLEASFSFSFQDRSQAIQKLKSESFDILVVGGGITGAAVAREASAQGFKVALVERYDFASGTSSKSSKLIHGGLRYLQNFEIRLVFESLAERARLLKECSHLVQPLPFYFPVYQGDPRSFSQLKLGLWLYDILSLGKTPGRHRAFSKKKLCQEVPELASQNLLGGFQYWDAKMWDDVLTVETLRQAHSWGAAVANYVEALEPLWHQDQLVGFQVIDHIAQGTVWSVKAQKVILCAGPWTDVIGARLFPNWKPWLTLSQGVHCVFDWKRLPLSGAVVMSHPQDGRIAFAIPRLDYGSGVVMVGTTDTSIQGSPDQAQLNLEDLKYLLSLLNRYFPRQNLTLEDVMSAEVGVRPLIAAQQHQTLQKISREHRIDQVNGGLIIVAGGKYTTHRKIAQQVIHSIQQEISPSFAGTKIHVQKILQSSWRGRHEAECFHEDSAQSDSDCLNRLKAQLRYSIRFEMVMHLEDFYFRRVPLYMAYQDHGLSWANALAQVWAEELHLDASSIVSEVKALIATCTQRSHWHH